jgi:hypothetical protein
MDAPGMLVASTKAVPVVHRALLEAVEAHHAHVRPEEAGEVAHHAHHDLQVEVVEAVPHDLLGVAVPVVHHGLLVEAVEVPPLMVVEVEGGYLREAAALLVVLAPL